jgi:acyl carrier protein
MTAIRLDTEDRVTTIIREKLSVDVRDAETDLIDEGHLDSLALVMLIAALEESFACELPLDDFDIADFASVARIANFLTRVGVAGTREPW